MNVYEAILARAERALTARSAVVLDAVFARESERRLAERLARRQGAGFRGIWLEAGSETLKARVAARVNDASDATPDVIDAQLRIDIGKVNWTRVDASGSPAKVHALISRLQQEAS